ncbi:DUF262 domain-containing protein [Sphingobacterium kitahiroshimense]|uniref:DUF262 domain-containing protein n=1 Tax=Sphingobacterium kitahiroshimense TaxID=470446 RepID=UPI00320998D9
MSQTSIFDTFNDEDENDLTFGVKNFEDSVIWGTDWTTETIVNQLKRGTIDLNPKFQRRNAWDDTTKSRFIESLLLGLPIPQIILAEKKDNKGNYIVIDGKQRLLTIISFFSFDTDNFKPFKLKGLNILQNLNGKSYKDLEFNNIVNQLNNQSIRTSIIKNWKSEDFLYTVFLRLNTGSLKLSPQELRQALHPGPFIDYADDFSSNSFEILSLLNITKPDSRMRDVEFFIRYFTFKFYIEKYDGNLKNSFDNTVKDLNKNWENLEDSVKKSSEELNEAINAVYEIFGKKEAFSKYNNENGYQRNFNRAIYDIMVYYFSDLKTRTLSLANSQLIKSKFEELCVNNVDFLTSFEHTTKSIQNVGLRFNIWGNELKKITGLDFKIPTLTGTRIKLR